MDVPKKIKVLHYLNAGYPALWVKTQEPERAEANIVAEIKQWDDHRKSRTAVYRWDCLRGLEGVHPDRDERQLIQDPAELVTHLAEIPGPAVAFLENFHRFIEGAETVQALQNARQALAAGGVTLIAVSPIVTIPPELSKLFKVVPFELPTREELREVFVEIAAAANLGEQEPALLDELAEAAVGLTRFEAENAAALCSVVSSGKFSPEIVAHMKADMIRQSSTLEIGVFEEAFDELRGVDRMKDFALKSIASHMYRGILVLGPAGTGKTHFAKALGNSVRLPTIIADVNRVMAAGQALVGQAEAKAQQTVDIIDAQGRCVVMFDEIEKGLSSAYGGYQGDGGAKAGVGSILLRWMSDRPQGTAYVVATCNDLSQLPPEWMRAERWDAIFFVDLPDEETRSAILAIHSAKFGVDPQTIAPPQLSDWTGAEIKTLCRVAKMLGTTLEEAAQFVVPVCRTAREKIQSLRDWAQGRAVPAHRREQGAARLQESTSARRIVCTN
ncbi:MAG: AAA family ATPase [bacterium]